MSIISKVTNLLGIKSKYVPKSSNEQITLLDVTLATIYEHQLKDFHFLEIGVFKADNVLHLINGINAHFKVNIYYTGFDLFDDIDYLEEKYPEDYKQYNLEEYPYWEFNSGGHTLNSVSKKVAEKLSSSNFELIKGDTMVTLKNFVHSDKLKQLDLIYIDGCHDFEVVKSDWENSKLSFNKNPNLVVVFDDFTYEGVKIVYDEIKATKQYDIQAINPNQFKVILIK